MFGSKDKSPTRVSDSGAARQIDTVIAEHCTLAGDLTTKNSIKLDGRIEGTLRAEGRAIIGETGSVKGDVHAADLLVLGRLERVGHDAPPARASRSSRAVHAHRRGRHRAACAHRAAACCSRAA